MKNLLLFLLCGALISSCGSRKVTAYRQTQTTATDSTGKSSSHIISIDTGKVKTSVTHTVRDSSVTIRQDSSSFTWEIYPEKGTVISIGADQTFTGKVDSAKLHGKKKSDQKKQNNISDSTAEQIIENAGKISDAEIASQSQVLKNAKTETSTKNVDRKGMSFVTIIIISVAIAAGLGFIVYLIKKFGWPF